MALENSFELRDQALVAFVPTRNAAGARLFYQDQLGLPLISDQLPFALVFDAHGVMLRVTVVKELTPAQYTVLGWDVPDIDSAVKGLRARGIEFERHPTLNQDQQGIWTAPGGAMIAWFRDPDGNTLSVSQLEAQPRLRFYGSRRNPVLGTC